MPSYAVFPHPTCFMHYLPIPRFMQYLPIPCFMQYLPIPRFKLLCGLTPTDRAMRYADTCVYRHEYGYGP